MEGTDLKSIMEIMGHKTTVAAARYQHPSHDHKKQAVLALDRYRIGDKIRDTEKIVEKNIMKCDK